MKRDRCLGYFSWALLQKSPVSETKDVLQSIEAIASLSNFEITKAALPLAAVYSNSSPGRPWAVSTPIARPFWIIPDPTRPVRTCTASVAALQANSRSAASV